MTIQRADLSITGTVDDAVWRALTRPNKFIQNVKETTMIGGDTCHLCGAKKDYEESSKSFKKNDKLFIQRYTKYKCGSVYTKDSWYTSLGEEKNSKTKFLVGSKCIKIGSTQ